MTLTNFIGNPQVYNNIIRVSVISVMITSLGRILQFNRRSLNMKIVCCLYLLTVAVAESIKDTIPSDWKALYENCDLFYSSGDPTEEKLPGIGNGYLGSEVLSDKVYMTGVYAGDAVPKGDPSRAEIIGPMKIRLLNGSNHTDRALNIRNAQFLERFTLNDGSTVEFRHYAHKQFVSAMICDIIWEPAENSSSSSAVISINVPAIPIDATKSFVKGFSNITSNNITTWSAPTNGTERQNPVIVAVVYKSGRQDIELSKGQSYSIIATFGSTLDSMQPAVDALNTFELLSSNPNLESSHVSRWQTLWETGVDFSRFDVAQAFNSSMYSLLSSLNDKNIFSISSYGLTGNDDDGHISFGAETWIFPGVLLLHPTIAKSILEFRMNTIHGAVIKASSGGWNGTDFPWETSSSGIEISTGEQSTGGIHVNGDIVWAVRQYYYTTMDENWLLNVGYPIVTGIADFFVSRINFDSNYVAHLDNVNPPDTTWSNINDSVFTNYGACMALAFATEAAIIVGRTPDPRWIKISEKVTLPVINQKHPIFHGYDGGQTSSNADVVLLGFPFDMSMNQTVRLNDLQYYFEKTNKDAPAMTWSAYAIGFIETKQEASARLLFNKTLSSLSEPYKTWITPDSDSNNDLRAAGSWLQLSQFGYTGIRIKPHAMFINPSSMPEGCSYTKIRSLTYRGAVISLTFTPDSIMIEILNAVAVTLTDIISGKTITITSTQLLSIGKYELTV